MITVLSVDIVETTGMIAFFYTTIYSLSILIKRDY